MKKREDIDFVFVVVVVVGSIQVYVHYYKMLYNDILYHHHYDRVHDDHDDHDDCYYYFESIHNVNSSIHSDDEY